MMDRSHWLSLGVGLGAGVALWFRAPPPWRLAPAAATRRHAWDESKRAAELAARARRRRPLRLLLIRHGESRANTAPHVVGGRDEASPLTARGEREARALGRR